MTDRQDKIAILFSGGTDSTASSALMAEKYKEVHLLTYDRAGFYCADHSNYNAELLKNRFPEIKIPHYVLETTDLGEYITNYRRWHYIRKYGFFTLQNCGFCALLNHIGTIAYCLKHDIANGADGITHDWPFFPGHMDKVIDKFREMYKGFDLTYHTPVLHYDIDKPMHYLDKLAGFKSEQEDDNDANTTGKLLKRMSLSDVENYKGSLRDKKAQARCYQFALPNLFIYWMFRGPERWDEYEAIVLEYFGQLMEDSSKIIREYIDHGKHKKLFAFLDET